jgi:hypothetical protein
MAAADIKFGLFGKLLNPESELDSAELVAG